MLLSQYSTVNRVYCDVKFIVDRVIGYFASSGIYFVDLLLHCVYFVEAKDRQVLSTRCYKRRYLLVRLWCMSPRLP